MALWAHGLCSTTTYQKINSSIFYKGALNKFKQMFLLVRMFPLAVMHRGLLLPPFLLNRVSRLLKLTDK